VRRAVLWMGPVLARPSGAAAASRAWGGAPTSDVASLPFLYFLVSLLLLTSAAVRASLHLYFLVRLLLPSSAAPARGPGTLLNMLALALLGCSSTRDVNGLPAGAVLLGLAGITFHLSQLHVSNLFPRSRGLISSLLVAGFTGCGILFYLLDLIFVAAGSTRCGARAAARPEPHTLLFAAGPGRPWPRSPPWRTV